MPEITGLDSSVVSGVVNENFKVVASGPTVGLSQALAMQAQNAASHQLFINSIREFSMMEAFSQRAGADTSEAVAVKKISEADLNRTLAEAMTLVANAMQLVKASQSTPPISVPAPATG